ncbi:SPOR domain-containing protein [Thiolapillus sp.]
MRWALAILFSLNAVLFLWIQFGPARDGEKTSSSREALPDFGDIRLLDESAPTEADGAPRVAASVETVGDGALMPKRKPEIQPVTPQAISPPAPVQTSVPDEQPAPSRPSGYCGELGPFASRNMAEGFRRKLAADGGAEVGMESRKGKVNVGYWVMIPPLGSAAEAEAMFRQLQKAGFKDLWLMRKGEYANGISMGLYTEERYARRHGNNIRKKGFETVIVPKQKNARLFWLVFSGVDGKILESMETGKLPQNAKLRKKPCARGSAGN